MNNKKKISFGGSLQPNTFIGNVANLYPTKADLAAVLSVTANQISVFKIEGNDIQCYIGVEYSVTGNQSFRVGCTYYRDTGSKLTAVNSNTFFDNPDLASIEMDSLQSVGYLGFRNASLQVVDLPSATTIFGYSFALLSKNRYTILKSLTTVYGGLSMSNNTILEVCYIPLCSAIGGDTTNDNSFTGNNISCVYYVNPYVMTCNAGSPNPDIQYVIDRGSDVRPVTDFTVPNNVTDLHTTNIYSDRIEIGWTAPTSTNAIDWYAIYINGNFYGRTVSDETNFGIEGLDVNTKYAVQIVTVDYFFNRSLLSNIETFVVPIPNAITDLATHYIGETYIVVDWNKPSNMYYDAERYDIYLDDVFYKSTTQVDDNYINNLTFGNTYNIKVKAIDSNGAESNFSNELNVLVNGVDNIPVNNIVAYYNFNNNVDDSAGTNNGTPTDITYAPAKAGNGSVFNGVSSKILIPSNTIPNVDAFCVSFMARANNTNLEYRCLGFNDNVGMPFIILRFNNDSPGSTQFYLRDTTGAVLITTTNYDVADWLYISMVGVRNQYMKLYINAELVGTEVISDFALIAASPNYIGSNRTGDSSFLSGETDAFSIMNIEPNQSEITAMYNKVNNGQELI